jgi:hypothetical protein
VKVSVITGTPAEVAEYQRLVDGATQNGDQPQLETPKYQLSDAQQEALVYLRSHKPNWVKMQQLGDEMGYRRQHATWVCGQIYKIDKTLLERRTRDGMYEYRAR